MGDKKIKETFTQGSPALTSGLGGDEGVSPLAVTSAIPPVGGPKAFLDVQAS